MDLLTFADVAQLWGSEVNLAIIALFLVVRNGNCSMQCRSTGEGFVLPRAQQKIVSGDKVASKCLSLFISQILWVSLKGLVWFETFLLKTCHLS